MIGNIVRLDPTFDALVPKDAQIEKLAGGFTFIEGPLWRPSNALWFSDVVGNVDINVVTEEFRPARIATVHGHGKVCRDG